MKDRQSITDIFDLHVIGDDVALETRLERFSKLGIGIDQKAIRRGADGEVGIHSAFCAQDAGLERGRFGRLASVVCNLSVQETKAIISSNAKFCARGEIEKNAFPCMQRRRHFSFGATPSLLAGPTSQRPVEEPRGVCSP